MQTLPAGAGDSRGKALGLSMAANVAAMGMAGAASILASRLLGPQGRGEFAAILVWTTLAAALGDLGLSQACGYGSGRRPRDAGRIAASAVALSLATGAVLTGVLEFLSGRLFAGEAAAAARVYLLSVPLSMAVTCVSATLLGLGQIGRFNLIKTVQAAGYVAGIGTAWAMGAVRTGGLLGGILVFQVAAGLVALGCAASAIPFSTWRVDRATGRSLLAYGLRTYAGNLCWLANGRLDQALLACLAPMPELGIYAVAVSYSGLQFGISGAIATVTFSRAARAGSSAARRQELRRGMQVFAGVILPLAAVMALGAQLAIGKVYGAAFAEAGGPACILLLGGLFLGANYVASNCLRADGRPAAPVLAEAAGLAVTVAALPLVIPRWGITGAAWVSVASYAATAAILSVCWRGRPQKTAEEAI